MGTRVHVITQRRVRLRAGVDAKRVVGVKLCQPMLEQLRAELKGGPSPMEVDAQPPQQEQRPPQQATAKRGGKDKAAAASKRRGPTGARQPKWLAYDSCFVFAECILAPQVLFSVFASMCLFPCLSDA